MVFIKFVLTICLISFLPVAVPERPLFKGSVQARAANCPLTLLAAEINTKMSLSSPEEMSPQSRLVVKFQ